MGKIDKFIIDDTTYEIVPEIAPLFDPTTPYYVDDCVIHDAVLYKFTSNHAAGAWTGNDVEAIEVADRLNKISDSVAPEFNASISYTTGQYVYNNGVLYMFTASHSGAWTGTDVESVTVGGEITDLKADIDEIKGGGSGSGLTEGVKSALLACFQNVGWDDVDGAVFYNALYDALYPPANLVSISCVYTQSGTVYDTDNLDSLKNDLIVTAHFDDSSTQTVMTYTLSGMLEVGTSTITVVYGGQTTTFSVNVTEKPKAWYTGVPLTLGAVTAGSINGTTGVEEEYASYNRTDYIDIEGAHLVQSRVISSKDATGNNAYFCFYDADKDFISSAGFNSTTSKITISTVPADTKYVRFVAKTDCMGDSATTPCEFVPYATPTVLATTGTVAITLGTVGYDIYTTTGQQGSSGSKRSSQLIPIYGATSISATKDSDSSAITYLNLAFYDKDENYMGCVQSINLSQWTTIPYNECAYMRAYSLFTSSIPFTVSITV